MWESTALTIIRAFVCAQRVHAHLTRRLSWRLWAKTVNTNEQRNQKRHYHYYFVAVCNLAVWAV
jgi:hypothetical protein